MVPVFSWSSMVLLDLELRLAVILPLYSPVNSELAPFSDASVRITSIGKIIRMLSMAGVALSGLIFLECVAILQSDKISVGCLRVCLTSGFLKRFFSGCGTTAFSIIISVLATASKPVKMHSRILFRIRLTGIHAFLPCRLQVLIFLLPQRQSRPDC